MMHECSIGELLTRAAFLHHDDSGHDTVKQYVALRVGGMRAQGYWCLLSQKMEPLFVTHNSEASLTLENCVCYMCY